MTSLLDTTDDNDNVTTLREAIVLANSAGGPDSITFAPSLTSGGAATVALTQGELVITGTLTVTGPGQDLLSIDAQGNSRVINVTALRDDLSLSGLTISGGRTTALHDNGGGIRFGSGDWNDAGEQVFNSTPVVAGSNLLSFTIPAGATSGSTG